MSVYVDPMMACLRNQKWHWPTSCHLMADSVDELVAFATGNLGLLARWLQHPSSPGKVPHFDLTDGKRRQAVAAGAIEVTERQAVCDLIERLRTQVGGRNP